MLLKKNVIENFIAVVNCNRIGYREMLHFYIQVNPLASINDVTEKLLEFDEINVLYHVSGDYPIFAMVKCIDKPKQIALLEKLNNESEQGTFLCEALAYIVPNKKFRFEVIKTLPLG